MTTATAQCQLALVPSRLFKIFKRAKINLAKAFAPIERWRKKMIFQLVPSFLDVNNLVKPFDKNIFMIPKFRCGAPKILLLRS